MQKKIVVIGAGPVGCYTAQLLKYYGFKPMLIEEHTEVGRPLHCTGLVGSRLFQDKRPVPLPKKSIINTINGALIVYDGHSFAIKRKGVAFVIDRERFDKELSRGLQIVYGNRFLGLENSGGGYIIETDQNEFFADLVIGADGANSSLRKLAFDNGRAVLCKGVQLRMALKPRCKDMVEVYLKKASFIWIVPEGPGVVRIGTISENPYSDLQEFLKHEKIEGRILEKLGGFVSIGICPATVMRNLAIVGDAACQLKPLSYGGLYFGLKAAGILAACIKSGRLKDYDNLWKKEVASEISIGLKIRGVYNRLNRNELASVFALLKDNRSLIEEAGDFENHSRLLIEIIRKSAFFPNAGSLLRLLFRAVF